MTRALSVAFLGALLAVSAHGQVAPRSNAAGRGAAPAVSSRPITPYSPATRPLYRHSTTWYEFMLHEMNPHDTNWGAWYKRRREALVDASLRNPYFWHSFWVSLALVLLAAALLKSLYDRRREKRIMGEQMDEVRAHDAHSRRVAHEAIRQYNEHIELCNRAIEASGAGESSALGGSSEVATLRAERDEAMLKVNGLEGDKRRLESEVAQKTALITDLSLRMDALSGRIGGNGQGSTPHEVQPTSPAEMVRHINSLQQQLHAEREKNKRLKGGA